VFITIIGRFEEVNCGRISWVNNKRNVVKIKVFNLITFSFQKCKDQCGKIIIKNLIYITVRSGIYKKTKESEN